MSFDFFCSGDGIFLGHSPKNPLCPQAFTFHFPKRQLIALLGKNGSGKTTLLRALLGEKALVGGTIRYHFDGIDDKFLAGDIPSRLFPSLISYVPQEHVYPAALSVTKFIELAFLPRLGLLGKLTGAQKEETQRQLQTLELAPLADKRMGEISSGERQRAFLGRALLQGAQCLFLDEPTNHLDPGGSAEFWRILKTIQRDKPIHIVVVTHDLAFVEKDADWVLAMRGGAPIYEGNAQNFFQLNLAEKTFRNF